MKTGVLFIGHGTRRQHGVVEFTAFVTEVCARLKRQDIECGYAFLELQPPDIVAGVHALVQAGVTKLVCVPLFLFAAGHMKIDIPAQLALAQSQHPAVEMQLLEPFGDEPVLVDVVLDRLAELGEPLPKPESVLLLGRGNKDEAAQQVFAAMAARLAERLGGRVLPIGFLDGTGVTMEVALTQMVHAGTRSITIAPYLWFSGWLTDKLPARVAAWQHEWADTVHVAIAPHLGLHPQLTNAVAERTRAHLPVCLLK